MGRHTQARVGEQVKVRGIPVPYTFWPDSYLTHGRVVTCDPWRCISVHVRRTIPDPSQRNRAIAFLEQAEDFYNAEAAPRIGSRALLYYYCFMNLAKAFLVCERRMRLDKCMHGLRESGGSVGKGTIATQAVVANEAKAGGNTVQIYREFVKACHFPVPLKPEPIKLVDLLEQTVSIHRITSNTLGHVRKFFPVDYIAFEYDRKAKEVWVALRVHRDELTVSDTATRDLRKNTTCFKEVKSPDHAYRRYESAPRAYRRTPQQVLRQLVLDTWGDIWSELRPGGYKFWVSSIPAKKRLAQLASGYQAMFYFGSVARYRPDDFRKLVEGKHGWMVQEFINNQPIQFLYFLGSGIIDAEMVIPELVIR